MAQLSISRVSDSREFRKLVRMKRRLSWSLTFFILALYFGFISLSAFLPDDLASPGPGGIFSIGILGGVFIILCAIAITGIYVWSANVSFDPIVAALLVEVEK
ncbi:DUF485 domain-containing protein [Paraburkholderia sp. SIMBA_030]|uniref:DUF485 domain-containing protein n=1 Tax=Paraburkholderia sp. SIMBA_030 TaxID=3085773 RepID=UPI00397C6360